MAVGGVGIEQPIPLATEPVIVIWIRAHLTDTPWADGSRYFADGFPLCILYGCIKIFSIIIIRAATYSGGDRGFEERREERRGEGRCGEAQRYADPSLMRGVTTSVTPPKIWRNAIRMQRNRQRGNIYAN